MQTLERYAIKSLLTSFLAISFVILGLIWLTQSMRILDLIVNKGVGFFDFLHVSMLTLPSLLFLVANHISISRDLFHIQDTAGQRISDFKDNWDIQ